LVKAARFCYIDIDVSYPSKAGTKQPAGASQMNFELPEDVKMLRDMARKFAAEVIGPNARTWDREGLVPDDVVAQLGELGFLGVYLPEAYGGAEAGYLAMSVIIEEIARQCGGTALMIAAHNGLPCGHIFLAGNEAQKKKYLPKLARGQMLGSWALTEPGSGSDAAALKTTAVRDGDSWVLNGSKNFITNGHRASVFVIMARTDPQARKTHGISAFLVERDTPGFTVGPK
jgi:alkylation response protein AidB-like acyl-CoA dehydrogenase